MRAIRNGLNAAGIPVENSKGEWGPGQEEINVRYAEALEMADRHAVIKNGCKEIAHGLGRAVTFMAKWDYGMAGSSCHVHQSLWSADGTSSLFFDRKGHHGMSEMMQQYLAGQLAHAGEITYFLAPYINSYKRFLAGTFAPTRAVWSFDNRTAGYRICGERAVRVDILERLADLIRPALAWREGAPGPKPEGFFDGRSFLISGAMTSLTGASGEDFASILRSLGYRMDRKPKPLEVQAVPGAAAVAPDAIVETPPAGEAPAESVPVDSAATASATDVSSRLLLPGPEFVPAEVTAQVPTSETIQEPAPAESAAATPVDGSPTEAKVAEDPAFIEVWRPAGRSERRPHRPRRPHRQQVAQVVATDGAAATPAGGEAAAASPTNAAAPSRDPRRPRRPRDEGSDREKRQERYDRQQRLQKQGERSEHMDNRPRGSRPRRERGESVDRAERERYYAKPFGNSGTRDKQPDPNSPFAKLAALKQQLEQSGKEPS
jgi:hypothetical protein